MMGAEDVMNKLIKELFDKKFIDCEISALGALLAGEISAVEAYNEIIQKVKDINLIPTLQECRDSHALRIRTLRIRLKDLGVTPRKDAGFMGALIRFIEGGAAMIGDRTALQVLAVGENYGSEQYQLYLRALAPASWRLVTEELVPSQRKTEHVMKLLCALLRINLKEPW